MLKLGRPAQRIGNKFVYWMGFAALGQGRDGGDGRGQVLSHKRGRATPRGCRYSIVGCRRRGTLRLQCHPGPERALASEPGPLHQASDANLIDHLGTPAL